MGAPIDLAGQRFGRLVAVEVAQERPRKWRCRCDCGNETSVLTRDLRNGNTKSCGCMRDDFEDLSGRRFGRLVAVERVGSSPGGYSMWRCACDCGGEVTARSVSLKNGNTRSCGCLVHDKVCEPSDAVDGTKLGNLSGKPTRQNTSGVRGVSRVKRNGRWEVHIKVRGKQMHIGTYATIEDAAEARREAEREWFDPILEAHGHKPTSEEDYQETLRKAMESQEKK